LLLPKGAAHYVQIWHRKRYTATNGEEKQT